jgi:hypothetical protein
METAVGWRARMEMGMDGDGRWTERAHRTEKAHGGGARGPRGGQTLGRQRPGTHTGGGVGGGWDRADMERSG